MKRRETCGVTKLPRIRSKDSIFQMKYRSRGRKRRWLHRMKFEGQTETRENLTRTASVHSLLEGLLRFASWFLLPLTCESLSLLIPYKLISSIFHDVLIVRGFLCFLSFSSLILRMMIMRRQQQDTRTFVSIQFLCVFHLKGKERRQVTPVQVFSQVPTRKGGQSSRQNKGRRTATKIEGDSFVEKDSSPTPGWGKFRTHLTHSLLLLKFL